MCFQKQRANVTAANATENERGDERKRKKAGIMESLPETAVFVEVVCGRVALTYRACGHAGWLQRF